MIKLQFKLPQTLTSLGFTRRTVLPGKRKRLLAKTKDDISKAGFHVGKDCIGIFTSLGKIKGISNGQVYSISVDAHIATTIHS